MELKFKYNCKKCKYHKTKLLKQSFSSKKDYCTKKEIFIFYPNHNFCMDYKKK